MKKAVFLGLGGFLVAVVASVLVFMPNVSTAADASKFDAGRIIDDSVFFDKDTMSVSQIQQFLDSKVPVCDTNGDKFYNGVRRRNVSSDNPPPYTCLKDYYENPDTHANNYGDKPIPAGAKSAAWIIHDAAQRHGINPQVLIVFLQKEQGLVTDDWPWERQYEIAMGYGCPDTAPCNEEYYGFYNQVNKAAWQLDRYVKFPQNYTHAVGDNYVLWHPDQTTSDGDPACGGSMVNIRTAATAALYNYTPYQPNQAALDAGYGTGNDCSAYGNRNFYLYFVDWFGSTFKSIDYGWRINSAQVYVNSTKTKTFTRDEISLLPGETVYITVEVQNIGQKSWPANNTKIATNKPRDRASKFADTSWLNSTNRVVAVGAETGPGISQTLEFTMTAPDTLGTYTESFGMVAEGTSWLTNLYDESLSFTYHVTTQIEPSNTNRDSLEPNDELLLSDYLLSADGHNTLRLSDKSLSLLSSFELRWRKSSAIKLKRLVMQSDGNLVLYDKNGNPVWHTKTNGNPGARFLIQTDGNMVVYASNGTPLWSSSTIERPQLLKQVDPSLPKSLLLPGQKLETADRKRKLVIQGDGNLVLYKQGQPLWATYTIGEDIDRLAMQGDGNLVLYNTAGKPVWHTRTNGQGESELVIQEDNNLVLYRLKDGKPIWHTGTHGR